MNNNINLLIFDFDGTLANTTPHIINCILKCIDRFKLKKLSYSDIRKYNGAFFRDVLKKLGVADENYNEVKAYFDNIFFEDISDIKLYDNVLLTLEKLKDKGYTLVIASNRGTRSMMILLKELGIYNFFDTVVCGDDVINKKPSADMVNIILERLHFTKNQTLVIGDTKFDIEMGKNAECKTCYVCHEEKEDDSVLELNPDIIIYNFNELLNMK